MKAILVIDMPKSCKDCKLTYLDTGDDAYYGSPIQRCIFDGAEVDADERYYDCPLKPMPEKKQHGEEIDYEYICIDGWNACLEELEK